MFVDIDVGTIISFYNGIKVRSDHEFERPTPYKMLLDDDHDIDIPDTMTTLDNYSATLGHKVEENIYFKREGLKGDIFNRNFLIKGHQKGQKCKENVFQRVR